MFTKLLGLRYQVVYRRGAENVPADALSRREHTLQLAVVSSLAHVWLEELQSWYPTDQEAKHLLQRLLVGVPADSPFQLKQGIIFYKDRIWLGSNVSV